MKYRYTVIKKVECTQ